MAAAVRLSSSLRTRPLAESLRLARELAPRRGVSRVVDTTWLDRIGIPVFSSVRPDAHPSALCVHAGKGFTPAEAEIGAYMEAIEYSFSEEGRNRLTWRLATPPQVLASFQGQISYPQFCPSVGTRVESDEPVAVVEGDEVLAGLGRVVVPAELVFAPFLHNPGRSIYGSSSNGVASGNTVDEACVHALAEVMERDVQSFATVGAATSLVEPDSFTGAARTMLERIESAGLRCHVRHCPNDYGLPHLAAYIVEPEADEYSPMSVMAGIGFHCNRDIAAVRAIAEAVQSRSSTIHGGRDDLVRQHSLARKIGADEALRHLRKSRAAVAEARTTVRFEALPDAAAGDVDAAWQALTQGLLRAGLRHVVRLVYTAPDDPFQVVRIIVPGAEYFEYGLKRIGPRLLAHLAARAGLATDGTA